MVKFERKPKKPARRGPPRRGPSRSFSSHSSRRPPFRKSRVTCDSCSAQCEVPFKPTSNKPVYCDNCFSKKGNARAPQIAENDLDIINEKLNKIMKALKIK